MKPIFVFLLLSLITAFISAADIPLGTTLTADDPNSRWNSPNNNFFFSFIPDPTVPTGTLIAAVTYNNISIWQTGASATSSAVLRLHTSGDLQLLPSPSSTDPLWSSGTANRGVSTAALDDSGNFVLRDSSGAAVWSTFDHPTDTIVPTQNLTINQTLSSGLYSFRIQNNGNLTLLWNNTIIYFNSALNSTSNSNLTNPTLQIVQPTGIVTLSDPTLSSPRTLAYSSDYSGEGNPFRFLKLDTDGNLRIYSTSISSANVRWAAVSDQCQVYGFCGNLGICSYNDTSPICECPSLNFDPIDPNDRRKGCKRKTELRDCPSNVTMLRLDNSVFSTFVPELATQIYFAGITACRSNCLSDPACIALTSLSDGSGQCYMKPNNGLVSGYSSPSIPSTSFVKVCPPLMLYPSTSAITTESKNGLKLSVWLVIVVVLVTLLGLLLFEGGLWWWCCKNSPKFGGLSAQYALLEYASGAPVQFSYKELHKSTKGFKEKLGAGGFGAVYKGALANRAIAAVKQLEGIEQGEKQFRMEVATISSTHHLNLVRLIGFCSEGRHRLLVYEFMKNGSLDSFLFTTDESQSGKFLNWECRFNVALGTARGITYLHEECRDCIVHCDIKPENILLDENFHAKVSDFGLAKLVNPKDHRYRTLTSLRGTRGYLAPEWLANLPITSKSDVYSYGMVLLEIVSGRRNFEVSAETGHKKFTLWAYEEFEKGNFEAIVDRRLGIEEIDMEQVVRAIQVSFWCIQEQPSHRPMMGKVVQMLEGILVIDRPPAPNAATEGSTGGASMTTSSVSGFSTFANSAQVVSSSSFSTSRKHGERALSSLFQSDEMME